MNTNRILRVDLRDTSLVPSEAVVHVSVHTAFRDGDTKLSGRLMGPVCRFATTVEVAHHLRPFDLPAEHLASTFRAVVPEAVGWSPAAPLFYRGLVELRQCERLVERREIRFGVRRVALNERGLFVNGRACDLRGERVATLDDARAQALRDKGVNLVIAETAADTLDVWRFGDEYGLFIVGVLRKGTLAEWSRELSQHPCSLGWIAADDFDAADDVPEGLLGVESGGHPLRAHARFALEGGRIVGVRAGAMGVVA